MLKGSTFTVYSRPNSSNCQKVLWLFEETGTPLEVIPAGMQNELNKNNPKFLALNPTGLVPLLEHKNADGSVFRIDESNTILRYVCAVLALPLGGSGDLQRQAKISRWMDFVISSVEVAMKPVYFHHIRGVKLSEEELAKAVAGAVGVFKIVETFLENGGGAYLVGDFSIADICIGAQLHRFYTLNIERPTLPKLQAYYNLLKTRPLYEKLILNERFV